ncbi:MAG TPA: hypothetical protein VGO34_15025 [Alphaproteobacteria bacterium]
MIRPLQWAGTAAGVAGAFLVAANVPASGWGFLLFLINSTTWATAAALMRNRPLLLLNLAFCAANGVGIWRWLI